MTNIALGEITAEQAEQLAELVKRAKLAPAEPEETERTKTLCRIALFEGQQAERRAVVEYLRTIYAGKLCACHPPDVPLCAPCSAFFDANAIECGEHVK